MLHNETFGIVIYDAGIVICYATSSVVACVAMSLRRPATDRRCCLSPERDVVAEGAGHEPGPGQRVRAGPPEPDELRFRGRQVQLLESQTRRIGFESERGRADLGERTDSGPDRCSGDIGKSQCEVLKSFLRKNDA